MTGRRRASIGPRAFALPRLSLIALLALAFGAGCSVPLLPATEAGIQADPAAARFALALPSIAGVASFSVSGSGPDGASFGPSLLDDQTLRTAETLALGEWTFTVEALDSGGTVMATGIVSYTIDWNDEIAELVLPMDEAPGSIGIYVSWDAGDLLGPGDGYGTRLAPAAVEVAYELKDAAGATVPGGSGTVAVAASATSAWDSVTGLAPGMYLLRVQILVDGFAVWGGVRPVAVRSGFQTTASFSPLALEVNAAPNVYAAAAPGEYLPFETTTLVGADSCTDVAYTVDGSDPPAVPGAAYGGESISLGPWNVLIRAENAWGAQAAAEVDPETYSFAIHVSTSGDDANQGTAALPIATPQVAVDLAAAFANTFPAGALTVQVRIEQGEYVDTNSLVLEGDIAISGGWMDDFAARSPNPALTSITRNPPNGAPPITAVTVPGTYTGAASLQGLTVLNTAPNVTTDTTAIYMAGTGRLTLMDCVLDSGSGDVSSTGILSVGGADLVLLRNRIWGGAGASEDLGGTVRGVLVDGGSPSVYLASNAIMARKPSGATGMVDAVGVGIVADSGEAVDLLMYGNTVVADGDTSFALELDTAGGGTISSTVVNTILAAPGGASVPDVAATNYLATDLAVLDAALAGDLAGIVDYASFAAMDWTPAATTEGDALANLGSENPDQASSDEDFDLAGNPRTFPWSIGAMERE